MASMRVVVTDSTNKAASILPTSKPGRRVADRIACVMIAYHVYTAFYEQAFVKFAI